MTQPRKSRRYVPEVSILLRDAELRTDELNDSDRLRDRDLARDELLRMYGQAERVSDLQGLDPDVRLFCEDLKRANGGTLPARKGGRPKDDQRRLMICRKVQARVNTGEGLVDAINNVAAAECPPLSYEAIRGIWFDPSPEWKRDKHVTLAIQALQTGVAPRSIDKPGRKRRAQE